MDQHGIEERLSHDAPLGADKAAGELEVRHFVTWVGGQMMGAYSEVKSAKREVRVGRCVW